MDKMVPFPVMTLLTLQSFGTFFASLYDIFKLWFYMVKVYPVQSNNDGKCI